MRNTAIVLSVMLVAGCRASAPTSDTPRPTDHASHSAAADTGTGPSHTGHDPATMSRHHPAHHAAHHPEFPPGAPDAQARLDASPRHAEWVMIPAGADSVRAWIVYPERKTNAPVVLVVHEIFGLTPWIRSVADQLAADGFIAIAPDLLTSRNIPGSPLDPVADSAVAAIRTLNGDDVHRQLAAVARYGTSLPAATKRYGIVGFCWGGSASFEHAVRMPELGASVVYYGGSPDANRLASVRAPVLGLYGADDARVNATVPPADSAMRSLGKTFQYVMFDGAGHGFLRQQQARDGANLAAAKGAWPRTVAWFRQHLSE